MTRRDNGLPATSYVRLRDVETHIVEGLLDRLRDEDVAAYVQPAPGKRGPYGDTVLPGSPTDVQQPYELPGGPICSSRNTWLVSQPPVVMPRLGLQSHFPP